MFLVLWRKLPEFEYDASRSFHAWLKTIFLNRHRDRQRQRDLQPLDFDGDEPAAQTNGPEHAEEVRYLIRQAFRLIEREFTGVYVQAFRAYVLEERGPDEVARELGISPGTVYAIKSKILSRLRQELKELID